MMLYSSGENRHHCFIFNLKRQVFSLIPLWSMLAVFVVVPYQIGEIPSTPGLMRFLKSWMDNVFFKCFFSSYIGMIIFFFVCLWVGKLFLNPRLRICLLILEREKGGEREKHWPVASGICHDRVLDLQPRYVPWLGIKPATWCTAWCSNQMSHLAKVVNFFLKIKFLSLFRPV